MISENIIVDVTAKRIRAPNAKVHADGQIAFGDKTLAHWTAQRMKDAGLDCHGAIYAIG